MKRTAIIIRVNCVACLSLLLFFSVAAFAQQNCAYTYTKAPSFSFCLTPYGTIGMIQSPVGNNLLDPNNPIEGLSVALVDSGEAALTYTQIPGLGMTDLGLPDLIGPAKGPGTFPLVAKWTVCPGQCGTMVETITANMVTHTITMKYVLTDTETIGCPPSWGFPGCTWQVAFSKVAVPVLGKGKASNFGSSASAGFAFLDQGLMLSGPCGGVDPAGVSQFPYLGCQETVFQGTGAIYAIGGNGYAPNKRSTTLIFTYTVF
jgi:hypothetical protein